MVDGKSSSSPSSMKEQLQASANQIWTSMKQWPNLDPSDQANNDTTEEGAQVSLESVIRIMFGSCAGGISPTSGYEPDGVTVQRRRSSSKQNQKKTVQKKSTPAVVDPPIPKQTKSEEKKKYKNNLFTDDLKKAEDAVCHLREQMELKSHRSSPPRNILTQTNSKGGTPKSKRRSMPSVFPVSTPKEKLKVAVAAFSPDETEATTTITTPPSKEDMFDDEISAISQHTLEELAMLHQGDNAFLERVHSDVTQDPIESTEESWKVTANPNNRCKSPTRVGSPLRFTRARTGRSQGTLNTKQTLNTKSTMSTATNEFANLFKNDELRYWQEVVKGQDEGANDFDLNTTLSSGNFSKQKKALSARDRMRKREKSLKRDGTISTVGSSTFSRSNKSRIAVSTLDSDPDRMMDVIVVPPGTEIGEI